MSEIICAVPGCEREFKTVVALGPHYAKHRKDGDKGVPPARYVKSKSGKSYTKVKNGRHLPAVVKPKSVIRKADKIGPFTPRDVIDMGLVMMFPVAVPREDAYDVAQWINHTEALASRVLSDA
jgi:hypothetical protein